MKERTGEAAGRGEEAVTVDLPRDPKWLTKISVHSHPSIHRRQP